MATEEGGREARGRSTEDFSMNLGDLVMSIADWRRGESGAKNCRTRCKTAGGAGGALSTLTTDSSKRLSVSAGLGRCCGREGVVSAAAIMRAWPSCGGLNDPGSTCKENAADKAEDWEQSEGSGGD